MPELTGKRRYGSGGEHCPGRGRKLLFACGPVSSCLYLVMDGLSSRRYEGYSYTSQAVSELNASGAPTRRLFLALAVPYNVLLAAFSLGVSLSAGREPAARKTGAALGLSAIAGAVTPLWFPMDRRGDPVTRRGRLHPAMTLVGSLFILIAMLFGALLHGGRFRLYTYGTIVALLLFGGWTALDAPRLATGQRTPGMGLKERGNIYAYLLWVAVLGISLWSRCSNDAADAGEKPG